MKNDATLRFTVFASIALATIVGLGFPTATRGDDASSQVSTSLEDEFREPPREFTLLPFWFWNDELSNDEIARQIEDFERHGVHGFTIHPRIGLPEDTGVDEPEAPRRDAVCA